MKTYLIIAFLFCTSIAKGQNANSTKTGKEWCEWRPFGTYLFVRAKEVDRITFDGRKIVKLEVQLKQNTAKLDAENPNFGDYRIVLSPTVAGPTTPPVADLKKVGLEFSRTTEQVYTWPEPVYCFEEQTDEYMKGKWSPELCTVEYTPHNKPGDVYYGALFLYRSCDDQAFKGQFLNCRGYDFIKVQ